MEKNNPQTKKQIKILPIIIGAFGVGLTIISASALGIAVTAVNKKESNTTIVTPNNPTIPNPTIPPIEELDKMLSEIDFYKTIDTNGLPLNNYKNKVLTIHFSSIDMLYGDDAYKFLNNIWIPQYVDKDTEIADVFIVKRYRTPKAEHLYVSFKARKRNQTMFEKYLTKIVVTPFSTKI